MWLKNLWIWLVLPKGKHKWLLSYPDSNLSQVNFIEKSNLMKATNQTNPQKRKCWWAVQFLGIHFRFLSLFWLDKLYQNLLIYKHYLQLAQHIWASDGTSYCSCFWKNFLDLYPNTVYLTYVLLLIFLKSWIYRTWNWKIIVILNSTKNNWNDRQISLRKLRNWF